MRPPNLIIVVHKTARPVSYLLDINTSMSLLFTYSISQLLYGIRITPLQTSSQVWKV